MGAAQTPRPQEVPFAEDHATALLRHWLGRDATCHEVSPLDGGICSAVFRLSFDRSPYAAVVKLRNSRDDNPLPRERTRLAFLRQHTNVPCPDVYLEDDTCEVIPYPFLLLEHLPGNHLGAAYLTREQRAPVEQELADVLLELHSHKAETFHGVGDDSGASRWSDVFLPSLEENRRDMIEFLPDGILKKLDAVLALAPDAFQAAGEPTLIHNDLSPGNIIVRNDNDGWHLIGLVDPVGLQYADVEKELSYLLAFDTVGEAFLQRYTQSRPLRPGFERRKLFYWADTYMTHVWLGFGTSFHDRILTTCDDILAWGQQPDRGDAEDRAPHP